jgi:hypothetical protein
LIAKEEGFFKSGNLPARQHNPGDLRHSPHSAHPGDPEAVGVIDTDEHGWEDLERQLKLYADRMVTEDPATKEPCPAHFMNLRDAIYTFAPENENNTTKYLADVLAGFAGMLNAWGEPVRERSRLSDVLTIEQPKPAAVTTPGVVS